MLVALAQLNKKGFKNLIVDLRGNQGGYMHTAIQMANVFLPKNQLIVYTEGRKSPRENYFSDGQGNFRDLPIVVLVDEGSASASEIFAGAIRKTMTVAWSSGAVLLERDWFNYLLNSRTAASFASPPLAIRSFGSAASRSLTKRDTDKNTRMIC